MEYEYPTNFSNGTSVIDLGTLMEYVNYVSEGWFAYGFLLIIFVMSFATGMFMNGRKALMSSSFITFIFSVYFMRLDMIHPMVIFGLILLIIIGVLGSNGEGGNM